MPSTTSPSAPARPDQLRAQLLLVLMSSIWAVNYSVVKFGGQQWHPLAYNAARTALAGVALALLAWRPGTPAVRPADRRALMLRGLVGHGLYQVLFVVGLAQTRAGNAALVASSSPALTALVAALLGVERLRARTAGGIALAGAGIGTLMYGSAAAGQADGGSLQGDIILLLATLSWAWYAVLMKPYADRLTPVQLTTWSLAGGFPALLLLALPSLAATHWNAIAPLAWASVGYGGLAAMVVAMLAWSHGVRVLGPTRTALFGQLQPVIAVLFAWATLGEVPTPWQALGALLVASALLLARR